MDASNQSKTPARDRIDAGGYAVPLVVGVTGHRDLSPAEIPHLRELVREFLGELTTQYPDCVISVLTMLAEGADQLVAEEALEIGLPITALLPMARDVYEEDFQTTGRRENFNRLCGAAVDVFEMPIADGNSAEEIDAGGRGRALQYAQAGVFMCAHSHLLLALWDGKESDDLGGTAHVVRFHQYDSMPGYTRKGPASRLMLADDESDLVYHIVCSRNRADGEPNSPLNPFDCWWFTSNEQVPRSEQLPARYRKVFECSNAFSSNAQKYAQQIAAEAWTLKRGDRAKNLPDGVNDIDLVFRIADWLAIRYQKKTLLVLRATHVLALLMGLMYIVYTNAAPQQIFILAFVALFALTAAIHAYGKRQSWHRRYLDYRALAEGLRVQFYWAAAGVTDDHMSKYAHDNFLQMQDPDLGWIRNVMRVAGTESDIAPHLDDASLAFVEEEWIGTGVGGQLGYYQAKSRDRLRKQIRTQRLSMFGLWTGIFGITVFVLIGVGVTDVVRDPLILIMGVILLLAGVRQSYAHGTADSELIKQYEFMAGIFYNARRRLDSTTDPAERRQVLQALGDAALEEHAEWILMHRERSIDQGEVWQMTGGA